MTNRPKKGNMLYEKTARKHKNNVFEDKTSEVKYRWDEDNRLLGVDENGFVSHYFYDANGERALKVLFGNEGRYINSMPDTISFSTEMSAVTLYISPYFVANNNHEFTKHIYMGGERIVSQICDPQNYGSRPTNETPAFNTLFTSYYTAKRDSIESCIESNYRYFGVPYAGGYDMEPEEVLRIGGGDIGDSPSRLRRLRDISITRIILAAACISLIRTAILCNIWNICHTVKYPSTSPSMTTIPHLTSSMGRNLTKKRGCTTTVLDTCIRSMQCG